MVQFHKKIEAGFQATLEALKPVKVEVGKFGARTMQFLRDVDHFISELKAGRWTSSARECHKLTKEVHELTGKSALLANSLQKSYDKQKIQKDLDARNLIGTRLNEILTTIGGKRGKGYNELRTEVKAFQKQNDEGIKFDKDFSSMEKFDKGVVSRRGEELEKIREKRPDITHEQQRGLEKAIKGKAQQLESEERVSDASKMFRREELKVTRSPEELKKFGTQEAPVGGTVREKVGSRSREEGDTTDTTRLQREIELRKQFKTRTPEELKKFGTQEEPVGGAVERRVGGRSLEEGDRVGSFGDFSAEQREMHKDKAITVLHSLIDKAIAYLPERGVYTVQEASIPRDFEVLRDIKNTDHRDDRFGADTINEDAFRAISLIEKAFYSQESGKRGKLGKTPQMPSELQSLITELRGHLRAMS